MVFQQSRLRCVLSAEDLLKHLLIGQRQQKHWMRKRVRFYTQHIHIYCVFMRKWSVMAKEPRTESEHFSTEEWSNLNIRAMEISCHSCLWYTLLCCVVLCCRNVLVRSILEKGKSINRHIWHDFVSISYRSYGWLIKWRTGHTQLWSPRKSYECMIYADIEREKRERKKEERVWKQSMCTVDGIESECVCMCNA